MNPNSYHSAYFLGIGGIGMSALARYLKAKGMEVSGFDRVENWVVKQLKTVGIPVHHDATDAPLETLHHKEDTIFIYTPAIAEDHPQLQYLRK